MPSTRGSSPRPSRLRRLVSIVILALCLVLLALVLLQPDNLRVYRLYFTEDRQPVTFRLNELSESWSEQTLKERFRGLPIRCEAFHGPLLANRACAVDVKSYNGVPVLYISFFFSSGQMHHVSINIPWWSHRTAYRYLLHSLGDPDAGQFLPRSGVRLVGWRMPDGSAIFYNRDWIINPLQWNAVLWNSSTACDGRSGCIY